MIVTTLPRQQTNSASSAQIFLQLRQTQPTSGDNYIISVTVPTEDMATIAKGRRPMFRRATTLLTENTTPHNSPTNTHSHITQPTENKTLGHTDKTTFQAKVITGHSIIPTKYKETISKLQPGPTITITSNIAPAPYVPDGLYNIKDNNLVQITMRNTDVRPLKTCFPTKKEKTLIQ